MFHFVWKISLLVWSKRLPTVFGSCLQAPAALNRRTVFEDKPAKKRALATASPVRLREHIVEAAACWFSAQQGRCAARETPAAHSKARKL